MPVIALGLLVVAITTAPSPTVAHATAEACHGRVATFVGTPGGALMGTDGPDVMVTNGASSVDAAGGDDLVCVTGGRHVILAGAGNDVVDTTRARGRGKVVLGPGDDVLTGGRQDSKVIAGSSKTMDDGRDVIDAGAGDDRVWSGAEATPNEDRISLSAGENSLSYLGAMTGGGEVRTHGFADDLFLGTEDAAPAGQWVLDAGAHHVTLDGVRRLTWQGSFHHYWFHAPFDFQTNSDQHGLLLFRGSAGDDLLTVESHENYFRTVARMGGGNDFLRTGSSFAAGNRFVGGSGNDTYAVQFTAHEAPFTPPTPVVSLRDRWVDYGLIDGSLPDAALAGFENLRIVSVSRTATVVGDRHDNRVFFQGCAVDFRGLGGADTFRRDAHALACSDARTELRGGPGHDILYGADGDDLILGGAGPDVAYGRAGVDTCSAERTKDCEQQP